MKKVNIKYFVFLVKYIIVLVAIIAGYVSIANYVPKNIIAAEKIQYIEIGDQKIKVYLSLTEQEQEQGLSGRANLQENEGMIFVFKNPSQNFFWMKDMNFPIDMIWISESLRVVAVKKDARPESYPTAYGPNEKTKYVLEVVSGFGDKYNIKEGDSIELLSQ